VPLPVTQRTVLRRPFCQSVCQTRALWQNTNEQVAQLSQRDRAAGWLSYGPKIDGNCETYYLRTLYRSIFNHCDVFGGFGQQRYRNRRKTQNKGYYAVQGHPRSSRSISIESPINSNWHLDLPSNREVFSFF